MLKVGYGRIDIMPTQAIGLGGYGNGPHRIATHVLDPLFATCIAITDEKDETLLLITMDLICMEDVLNAALRKYITEATGIPQDRIIAAATHTHYGPDVGNPGRKDVDDYIDYAAKRTVKAVELALADREEATVLGAVGATRNLNFVRHYLRQDGTVGGGAVAANPPVKHMADADNRLRLLRFCREEGKDILLMNWPCHPDTMGGGKVTGISADYVGYLRTVLEVETDCHFAFFQGAGGNITPVSMVAKPPIKPNGVQYAKELSHAALELMRNMKPIQTGPMKTLQKIYNCPFDHATDHQAPEAKKLWDYWLETGDFAGASQRAKELGYGSQYQARAILQRAEAPASLPMELDAIIMGELAFATSPCEMFDTAGAYVMDNSPCDFTMMLAYCNDSRGYFPNHDAFRYGCYEVDTHLFSEGSAEEMAETLVDMLKELKKQ